MSSYAEVPPAAPEPEVRAAVEAMRVGRAQEAISLLEPITQSPSPSFDAFYTLGVAYAQGGRMEPATDCLQRALRQRPQHAGALATFGHVFVRLNRKEEARAAFQQALAVEPGNAKVQQALAALGPAAPPADPELMPLGPPPAGADPGPLAPAPLAPPADGPQIGLAPRPAPPKQAPPGSVLCPQCGEANPEGYFACGLCGRPADRRAPVAAAAPAVGAALPPAASPYDAPHTHRELREVEETERTIEQEMKEFRRFGLIAGAIILICGVLSTWKQYERVQHPTETVIFWLILLAIFDFGIPFIGAFGVFAVLGGERPWGRRALAALMIAGSRFAISVLWTVVIDPLFGTVLDTATLGLGGWVLSSIVIYITTLTCIEKIYDTDLEAAHNLTWSVVITTIVLSWVVPILLGVLAVVFGIVFTHGH